MEGVGACGVEAGVDALDDPGVTVETADEVDRTDPSDAEALEPPVLGLLDVPLDVSFGSGVRKSRPDVWRLVSGCRPASSSLSESSA